MLPASAAALLAYGAYRDVVVVYAGVGLCAAWGSGALLKKHRNLGEQSTSQKISSTAEGPSNALGFRALLVTAVLDSAMKMAFLTFLPFVINAHGGSLAQTGLSLTLVFIGGAIGKFGCGWMADARGSARTIMLTEVATAVFIEAVLVAPLTLAMRTLPLLSVVLNRTSSVLYGAVTMWLRHPG